MPERVVTINPMRTFIAIEFPITIHRALDQRSQALRSYLRAHNAPDSLRWSTMDNAHLTLRFLGETTSRQTQTLATTFRELAAAHAPFELALSSIGGFPNLRQPRVIWLGIGGDLVNLNALQTAVEQAVQQVGFTAETRPFSPHITLARARREAGRDQLHNIGQLVEAYREEATPAHWHVAEFVHMQSDLRPTGAVYRPVARFRLGNQNHG